MHQHRRISVGDRIANGFQNVMLGGTVGRTLGMRPVSVHAARALRAVHINHNATIGPLWRLFIFDAIGAATYRK